MSPSEAGRQHSRTRAYLWPRARARAHSLALLGRSPAVGHPVRARANFSARERAQVRGFCGTRAHPSRALPPGPFGAAPGLRVGQMWKGFSFPCSPPLPSLLWLLEFEEKRSRGRRAGCVGGNSHVGLALPPCSLSRAGHRAPTGQPHSQKFPPLCSAFALRMDPESHHVKPGMFQSPSLSHSSSLSFSLTVSRQSPLLIHVIPWASFPFLNRGTPQPSWPTSRHLVPGDHALPTRMSFRAGPSTCLS